ncbi:class I SAM-dependent methyltransferase [Mangrovihabitans endophyticus]|uniref:Methyltransferase domain-containing protein n=1 Tax=Mangrovihabitans endophyticus TaxID=1751298 RepID=A0A8J3FM10_9ACTN|nr:class I SAM-dependent methyltransferase [Mangrovihabitans endophyticus]GGK80594.1 hypothetical protein GCM10012284_13160 [Mangrovihabitans endophyticus]
MTAPAPVRSRSDAAALAVYDRALRHAAGGRSARLRLHDDLGIVHELDPTAWTRTHLPGDAGLVARCDGPTLDVGCGPGRLTRLLHRFGCPALGIDVSGTAVRMARERGATALRRDVFGPLPGHGRWRHLLLADGNVGIGGDPVALLRRCGELISRTGRVHVELAMPGTRSWAGTAALGDTRVPFRWAVLSRDDVAEAAAGAAMHTLTTWTEAGRWFATLAHR